MRPRLGFALLAPSLLLWSQAPPVSVPEASMLVRDGAGRLVPVRLTQVKATVDVVGALATTVLELTFFNPQDRVLEGEFVLPLGLGQQVSRFGLDVNGRIREASVVDKAKGRQTFEAIVRRGVDPGLLEQVEGNVYKARVYPLPARGTRRVLIATEELLSEGGAFRLPLPERQVLDRLDLTVTVHQGEARPESRGGGLDLRFQRSGGAWRAQACLKDVRPDCPLELVLPRSEEPEVHLHRDRDHTTFQVTLRPQAPARPRPSPQRAALLWDVSTSSARRDLPRTWAFLEAYLRAHPDVHLEVATFSCALHERRSFGPGPERLEALRAWLTAQAADGGTGLGALDLRALAVDELLLASDGVSTLGRSRPKLPSVPLHALVSGTGADEGLLRALAEGTGGQLVDLTRVAPEAAVAALAQSPLQFLGCEGQDVLETYPRGPVPVTGTFTLCGHLALGATDLVLRFGRNGQVEATHTVRLDPAQARELPAVRRLWAQKKRQDLEGDPDRTPQDLRDHCLAHGLVSRVTSLLVLETLEDYLRYDIAPPAELRQAWEAARSSRLKDREASRNRHQEDVVAAYQERLRWWGTTFSPAPIETLPAVQKSREPLGRGVAGGGVATTSMAVAGAVAPPPPPPPSAVAYEVAPMAAPRADRSRSVHYAAAAEAPAPPRSQAPSAPGRPSVAVTLTPWQPDAPTVALLKQAPAEARWATYLRLKARHGRSSGFYLDAADVFRSKGQPELALRVLSNLAELEAEDPALLRILGHRLVQLRRLDLARDVFTRVKELREEEPQSWRDLALVLADLGQTQKAVDLLWEVVRRPWDARFPEISSLACAELNALRARSRTKVDVSRIDRRLRRAMPVDLRVVLTWDTNDCDIDLHVTDPRGETCSFNQSRTALGGRMSPDFTGGYGPEEFLLRHAMPGTYRIRAHFFGDRSQKVLGPTTLQVTCFTGYGTPAEKRRTTLLRLTQARDWVDVGTFTLPSPR